MSTALSIMLYTTLVTIVVATLVAIVIKVLCHLLQFAPEEAEAPKAAPAPKAGGDDADHALVIAIARRFSGK